jgi:DNA repair protein RecN (Recombination protein N)
VPAVPALASLRIRNLALVEDLEWRLERGFTVVTGETGSGKSIIVGALKLILGERADKSLIRAGTESCTVEAVFDLGSASSDLPGLLADHGVEPCEENQLIVKRVFSNTEASRQFVNGSPTTLAVLRAVTDGLVDLHGPHDHQSLLSPEKQLALLDAFAGSANACEQYGNAWRRLQQLTAERDALSANETQMAREMDLLRHQVSEIDAAALDPTEEATLSGRYQQATNARRLIELSNGILARLESDETSATSALAELARPFRELERLDPVTIPFAATHLRLAAELDDLTNELRRYADGLELEPEELARLEERVTLLETLKRKYGPHLTDVIAFGDSARDRLTRFESRDEELARLEREIAGATVTLRDAGAALTALRQKALQKIATGVSRHLKDLGFKKALFEAQLLPAPAPLPRGMETVEFLFGPNPGEPAKPLRAIASSGEISRVMLAIKSALTAEDTVALLVFDEIDANVGGEIAHAVGAKMRALAKGRQVLAITHLPQVAACGEHQFVVAKEIVSGRAISTLTPSIGTAREEEIARMLGGVSDSALAHARTLLAGNGA